MWRIAKNTTTIAELVLRNRIFGAVKVRLLLCAQRVTVPAINTIFAQGRRILNFRVVLEACTVAELLVIAEAADRKDVVVPGAVNAGANAQAISARAEDARFSVTGMCVRSIGAGENAMRVFESLAARLGDLDLSVQAQELVFCVEAHVVSDCELDLCAVTMRWGGSYGCDLCVVTMRGSGARDNV